MGKAITINKIACRILTFLVLTNCANAQVNQQRIQSNPKVFTEMMDRMMMKMDASKSSLTVESDFISQMIPHHEGAIEMAKYEIRHGSNFKMVQLAKSILMEQTSEVQQMQLWLNGTYEMATNTTKDYKDAMTETMALMMQAMENEPASDDIDKEFATVMIPHHQAAIDMAKVLLKFSKDKRTAGFASHIIAAEQIEIEQMSIYKFNRYDK